MHLRVAVLTLTLLLFCGCLCAQSSDPEYTLRKHVSEVLVDFTVTDHNNTPVQQLSGSDFHLLVDGSPVSIANLRSESDLPLKLVLLVDSSFSTRGVFDHQKEQALEFLKAVIRPNSDQVMIQRFDAYIHVVQPFTTDPGVAAKGLSKLPASSGVTSLYDAVYTASKQLMAQGDDQLARRAIILFSDGEDNFSLHSLEDAIEMAQRANSVVYAITLPPVSQQGNSRTGYPKHRGDAAMKRIAESTGGIAYPAGTDLGEAFLEIEDTLRSAYSLAFYARFASSPGFHSVLIENPKNLKVRCRSGYWVTNQPEWMEP